MMIPRFRYGITFGKSFNDGDSDYDEGIKNGVQKRGFYFCM